MGRVAMPGTEYRPEANCWPRFQPTTGTGEPVPDSAWEATAHEVVFVSRLENPSDRRHCVESLPIAGNRFTLGLHTTIQVPF